MSALGLALPDVLVTRNDSGAYIVQPVSRAAKSWGETYLDDPFYAGTSIAIDPDYIVEVIDGLHDSGLVVR